MNRLSQDMRYRLKDKELHEVNPEKEPYISPTLFPPQNKGDKDEKTRSDFRFM